MYLDLYRDFRGVQSAEKEDINDDIVFELELIRQDEVNIDYILMLMTKYHQSNCTDKNVLTDIDKAVGSSLALCSKKELIAGFVHQVNSSTKVDEDWLRFVEEQKKLTLPRLWMQKSLDRRRPKSILPGPSGMICSRRPGRISRRFYHPSLVLAGQGGEEAGRYPKVGIVF